MPSMDFVFRTPISIYVFMNTRYIIVVQIKIHLFGQEIWTQAIYHDIIYSKIQFQNGLKNLHHSIQKKIHIYAWQMHDLSLPQETIAL